MIWKKRRKNKKEDKVANQRDCNGIEQTKSTSTAINTFEQMKQTRQVDKNEMKWNAVRYGVFMHNVNTHIYAEWKSD